MFIPVWKPGALIYTGDSHAVQGDGENQSFCARDRMQELRIEVVLHKAEGISPGRWRRLRPTGSL